MALPAHLRRRHPDVRAPNNHGPAANIPRSFRFRWRSSLHPWRPDPGLRRRRCPQLALRAIAPRAGTDQARPGRFTNVGGPDELPNIEVVRTILELTGGTNRRSPTSATGSATMSVTASPGEDRGTSAGKAVAFREGQRRRLTGIARTKWWACPFRRVPPLPRAAGTGQARFRVGMARRLETGLEGLALIEPQVRG